jgi:hypothetical protein
MKGSSILPSPERCFKRMSKGEVGKFSLVEKHLLGKHCRRAKNIPGQGAMEEEEQPCASALSPLFCFWANFRTETTKDIMCELYKGFNIFSFVFSKLATLSL